MSDMKLIMEGWRSFISETVDTDISDAVSKNVALCKTMSDDIRYYILYNPIFALERLKHYTDYNGQYRNPPKDNYTNLNPFREAVQDSILSVITLKPSVGGKHNTGPYDANEVNSVFSNKKGFGRISYVIAMADHALSSDRNGSVTKFAQDVWRDFYNNSQEIEKEPKTGNLSKEKLPEDGIIRVKIDNIYKPETETKEDDGIIYAERGSDDPLNYVYFNLSKDKNAIQALQQNHEDFFKLAINMVDSFNSAVRELRTQLQVPPPSNGSFREAASSAFGNRYREIPDVIKYVKEELAKVLQEEWSEKYKKSIDCNNPKGFSQRAHCQGRKKNEEIELDERKLGKPSSETNLGDWFKRKGAPGKKGGWVDCNTCRDGKCKPCGRQEGEKRSKYPRCRPTPAQCKGYKRRGDNLQKEE